MSRSNSEFVLDSRCSKSLPRTFALFPRNHKHVKHVKKSNLFHPMCICGTYSACGFLAVVFHVLDSVCDVELLYAHAQVPCAAGIKLSPISPNVKTLRTVIVDLEGMSFHTPAPIDCESTASQKPGERRNPGEKKFPCNKDGFLSTVKYLKSFDDE